MVKFSHTLFALPFALSGAALAADRFGLAWPRVGWVLLAMVGARNAAMGFNRLADRRIDARNPRTAQRELPSGRLSTGAVWSFTLLLTGLFILATWQLGLLPFVVPASLIVFGYSYTKRFTWACHGVLGLALAIAPVGGWMALGGRFDWMIVALALAVLTWVAGFDVIYACQDREFDRESGLHSIPARFGTARALIISRGFHVATILAMVGVGVLGALNPLYWVGCAGIAGLLFYEHRLLKPDDLSKLGLAFFNLNGLVSVLYFVTLLVALVVPRLLA
ncbi:MAG: putative 4-hydroxybenzoate polyprenyltransferase [Acidobacteriota bacterium]|nr:putative 4-hydroxybenzoate polyprenyltransferase [Acidobacteriota bacterium]MDH3786091.1 putative 4-hydroxybenzoate polyprenyltransferase [Acidobacteriota bacterium]